MTSGTLLWGFPELPRISARLEYCCYELKNRYLSSFHLYAFTTFQIKMFITKALFLPKFSSHISSVSLGYTLSTF